MPQSEYAGLLVGVGALLRFYVLHGVGIPRVAAFFSVGPMLSLADGFKPTVTGSVGLSKLPLFALSCQPSAF